VRHWVWILKRVVREYFGEKTKAFLTEFDKLVKLSRVPVSRSKKGVLSPQVG
jgi:hypothetical protein